MLIKELVKNSLSSQMTVNRECVHETLSIYRGDYIYVKSAYYDNSRIIGEIEILHYPFTKTEYLNYVTAPMLMLYLSQLGYIFIRCMAEDRIIPITLGEFFKYRDEGRIMFCGFDDIRLRNKIYDSKKCFNLRLNLNYFHLTKTGIVGKIYFETEEKEFSGFATVQIYLG